MKKYIYYDIKNNIGKNVLLVIIYIIILFTIILIFNYKSSYINYFDYIMNNYYDARRLDAIKYDVSYDEMIEEISSINHVLDVFLYEDYSTALDVEDFEQDLIYINPGGEGFFPETIYGRDIENENEIICPIKMAKSSTSGFSTETIDMMDYLNKILDVKKDILYFYEYGKDPKVIDTKRYELKVVGLYDYTAFGDEPYYCYMEKNNIGNIIEETKEVYADDFWPEYVVTEDDEDSGIYVWLQVMVDDNKNVEYVENRLSDMGYEYELGYYIDYSYYDKMDIMIDLIVGVTLLILVIILILSIDKSINKRREEIELLKSIGYKNMQVTKIILANNLISFMVGLVISIILNNIVYYYFNKYIMYNAQLFGLRIRFNYIYVVVIILLFGFIFYFMYKRIYKKVSMILRRYYGTS